MRVRAGFAAVALGSAASLLSPGARGQDALERFERVQGDPTLADDPAAVEGVARDLGSLPPGRVQVQARMFVAEAWLGRMHRPDDAVGVLRAVTDDPEADPLTVRIAERAIVDARIDEGRLDEAAAEASSHADRLDPKFVTRTRRLLLRRSIRHGACGVIAAFATLTAIAWIGAYRRRSLRDARRALRRFAPVTLGFGLYLGVAGGALASNYETGNAAPFVGFGVGLLPLLVLARAWSAVGSTRRIARAGRAILCALSVFALAFLILDRGNATYLDGFGL